jgi:CBS-domain-containing membrane protein
MKAYFTKMKGGGKSPPGTSWAETGWSFLGAVAGMACVGALDSWMVDRTDMLLLIGSFAASSVLLYGAPRSPLAQPRNVLGGHVISALVGVTVRLLMPGPVCPAWLVAALAVAAAIAVMHITRTLHPPGGATAFIAVTGGPRIVALGYQFALVPAGLGAAVLLVVALVVNNAAKGRRYPEYWW